MLAELIRFEDEATLIMRTGLQFMDFGLTLDLKREEPGQFARLESGTSIVRLEEDTQSGRFFQPGTRTVVTPDRGLETPLDESVALLADTWLPIPFLRQHSTAFVEGPSNWARARLVPLEPGQDLDGHTHRLVLAFDTNVYDQDTAGLAYLAPTATDVSSGARFALAWRGNDMAWFPEQPWVDDWLREVFQDNAPPRLRMDPEDVEKDVAALRHHAHYLNVLWLLGARVRIPRLKILGNSRDDVHKPIPVDMVLDVGNSRTCGILIEDHPQEGDGLRTRYELELRDLTRPHRVYAEPFESRIEFAEAAFGKVDHSCHSGRNDAFVWPTIARVGPEATRLASRRTGTEGSTGLSSPKRYLWDTQRYEPGWRFNDSFNRAETEPLATAMPFGDLINDEGSALFTLPEDQQFQVFIPHYSRSSLMTFMLAEVLVQALSQMNSPGQRMKMSHANVPRQLRSVILTVPPSMPLPERDLFEDRMRQAMGLVWKAMGWHPTDAPIDWKNDDEAWPALPTLHIRWDEATCAQVVYLFSETVNTFGGRPDQFMRVMRRHRPGDDAKSIRIASIDIGGGTTDLVVTDYALDDGRGGNVYIKPAQCFRDGFKIAGDDIVLDVVQKLVVADLETALKAHGLADPGPTLSRLIGSEAGIVQDMVLRQQLTLQVLYPLALRLLKEYEGYDPIARAEVRSHTIAELLADQEAPSRAVLDYFAAGVRRVTGSGVADFDILSVPITVDMNRLHRLFVTDDMEICKPVRSLCELVHLYDCDVLLISGRPSRLPGVQALFRALLALPPDRIVPMHDYRTGNWYPFHRQGRIDDPKTTAAVGAMLCVLGQGRIPNFFFRSNDFKLLSTVRHIGLMDHNMIIKDEDVYFRDVDLDDPDFEMPEIPFDVRGRMMLGFRQLTAERWAASPLYMVELSQEDDAHEKLYGQEPDVFAVTLKRRKPGACRDVEMLLRNIERKSGNHVRKTAVTVRLHTLLTHGVGENTYWLDTGSIVR